MQSSQSRTLSGIFSTYFSFCSSALNLHKGRIFGYRSSIPFILALCTFLSVGLLTVPIIIGCYSGGTPINSQRLRISQAVLKPQSSYIVHSMTISPNRYGSYKFVCAQKMAFSACSPLRANSILFDLSCKPITMKKLSMISQLFTLSSTTSIFD